MYADNRYVRIFVPYAYFCWESESPLKKKKKASNQQSKLTLKGTREKKQRTKPSYQKEENKNWNRNKWKYRKDKQI